jgi:O-antigen ligase
VRWAPGGGDLMLSELLASAFVVLFVVTRITWRDWRLPLRAAHAAVFATAFVTVYLCGFFNLETQQALDQFVKGLGKFVIHFAFVVAAIAYLARRAEGFYWRALAWFFGGVALNAVYGVVQLAAAHAGHNLDAIVLSPLTHGASKINVYGAVEGSKVYRPNAMSGDPNHLAIMLDLPLLVLAPIYLRLPSGHPLQRRLAVVIAFLLIVELATWSRSGMLGLLAGAVVLAFPYRHRLTSRQLLAPLVAVAVVVGVVVLRRLSFFETVVRSRLHPAEANAHFAVYDFIQPVLHSHPLFGLGLNNFSVYYELVTGKQNWGPHSFYVAVLVESGLVGSMLFAVFLLYLFLCLSATRRLGRLLAAAGDPVAARVRPLAWGLTAALVATLAANAFYLTLTFFYFDVFVAFTLAAPAVFGRRLAPTPASAPAISAAAVPAAAEPTEG